MAHLLSVAEVLIVVITLHGHTPDSPYFSTSYVTTAVVLSLLSTLGVLAGGLVLISRSLRWFVRGDVPTPAQRLGALNIIRDQSLLLGAAWATGGLAFALIERGGAGIALAAALSIVLGGAAATGTGVLFSQRTIRPIIAAATRGFDGYLTAPGVLSRLINMWLLSSGLPSLVIAALIVFRSNGWLIPTTASVELPVLVLSLVAVMLGWRGMALVSRSIADPIREVVDAMAEIEHGQIGTLVDVYERSEIGRLQSGFNRMVTGLQERDRLNDLFGRYVGTDVARRAVQDGAAFSGEVTEAAILFVDLADSTRLTTSRPPQEVADVLNGFFRIVVGAVDERGGLINKFQGDAALAVFGVPLRSRGAASAALATARALAIRLRDLPEVDFGIGVSAGSVFAGNIGAENRYEYTVIGDAVNEAARLADLAKSADQRVLSSAAATDRADEAERRQWVSHSSEVLRGRSEVTPILAPGPAESDTLRA
ncbi:adenylate/guanylate cyclase domain-containing protein [[Mycobacterium] zoologicum]|uniref:adenylate/guanylate cyclase domain-containing protein n=1 Tax=[Mycobacterium] zoologicum TaxID=2872311 RepID=UPI001CDAEF8B|nr:adenylate/guanylate cyclase domain-containing protein [Mycolicibacter sp. MYC101]MEB3061899.1 adenylate/guanylate cyclase domain-containing protein [Mycolicibacter sp. MYC101]